MLKVLKDKITNPLDYFDYRNNSREIYQKLRERLFELLPRWEDFRRKRWKIEKIFQFLKENLGLGHIHAYTKRSVYKKSLPKCTFTGNINIIRPKRNPRNLHPRKFHIKQTP